MNLSSIDGILWGISLAGQLLVLAVLIKQRLYRMFPLFCAYIGYASLSDITMYDLYSRVSAPMAFRLYSVNNALEFCLQIGILLEIGWIVLNPVKRSLPRASIYFLGVMLVIALCTALLLSMHSRPTKVDRWAQYLVYVSFAVAILRLTLFGVIAAFSQMLGIGWKNHVFQIATGLLAYSISILLVELLHRMTGVANQPLYHFHDQFRIVAWCMVLGYWSYVLSRAEAARKEFSPKMAQFLIPISEASRAQRSAADRWYRK